MKYWNKILELFYPNRCCFCGEISEKEVCASCIKKIVYIQEPRCKKCGRPVRYEEQEYCYECQKRRFYYEQGKAIWLHKDPVSHSIYQFKYHNRRIYGKFYAKELYRLFRNDLERWKIDVIIPIPLHNKRRRIRGFNQAEVVADHLGKMAGIPVETKKIKRVKTTKPQKELNDKERRKNLKKAFVVEEGWKIPKNVLIVDDIYTTGSTVDAVAELLKKKGDCNVWFLTISIGQGF